MPKALSISGIVVALVVLLLFGLDLATSVPFGRRLGVDIGFVIAAATLGYLSWVAFREQP